jgi:hypothetical protein
MASPSPILSIIPDKKYVNTKYKSIIDKYVTDINLDIHDINDSIFNESIYNQNIGKPVVNNTRKKSILDLIKEQIKEGRGKSSEILRTGKITPAPLSAVPTTSAAISSAKTPTTAPTCNTRKDLKNNDCLKSIRDNLISGEINKLKEVTTNIGQIWSGINDYIVETTDIKLNIVFVQENDSRLNDQNTNKTEYEENIDIFLSSLLTEDNIKNNVVIDLKKPIKEVKQIIETKINTSPSSYIPLSSSRGAPPPVAPSPPHVAPAAPLVIPTAPRGPPSPPVTPPSPPVTPTALTTATSVVATASAAPRGPPSPPPVTPPSPPVTPTTAASAAPRGPPPPPVTPTTAASAAPRGPPSPPVTPSPPPSSKKPLSLSALISDPGNANRFFRNSNDSDDDTNSNQDQQWKN